MIDLIVFDIDGVITDGSVIVDSDGNEQKRINLKDIDAIFELHRKGYQLAAITGENTKIVDYFKKRFPWDYFYFGNKSKKETLKQIEQKSGITREHICYIGDGKYDIAPLTYAGLGICPADAIDTAKQAADIILDNEGGKGCLWELISVLDTYNEGMNSHYYFYHRLKEEINLLKKIETERKFLDELSTAGDIITDTLRNKGKIYVCIDRKSSVDKKYIASEFIHHFDKNNLDCKIEILPIECIACINVENHHNSKRIYARDGKTDLHVYSRDMLICFSMNKESKDCWEALRYTEKKEITSILFTEELEIFEDNNFADYVVGIPHSIAPRIQDAYIFIVNMIADYVKHKMFEGE